MSDSNEHVSPDTAWRKSSRSATNASCVEVAVTADVVGVRDTKDRDGDTLAFNRQRWNDFLSELHDQR